ncbi:MAG: C1 family peptidase [Bacteroidales bacterium]
MEFKPGYFENSVLKDNRFVEEKMNPSEPVSSFRADVSGLEFPNKLGDYKTVGFYFPPVSQGNTSTCWSFSTTSFYESEVYRLTGQKIRISELYTVYWEHVEKARRFVQQRGNSLVDQGSEGNALARIYKMYGAVPLEAYTGLLNGRKHHNHEPMMREIQDYLNSVKTANAWNEEEVLETVKSILNYYMGVPPTQFTWSGKTYTPGSFLKDALKLNMDDYVEILSCKQEPYWQQVEYKVPDNWWHSKEYYNVPLDVYMEIIHDAIRKGYTMSIGGDVSEPGLVRSLQVAVIPEFDIPSAYINEDARQFRFSNQTTTDDHGMHLVGYTEKDGKDWYLIKDSSSGSRNNDERAPEFGYYFFSEDYVKLKMMGFTIHRSAITDVLKKFK